MQTVTLGSHSLRNSNLVTNRLISPMSSLLRSDTQTGFEVSIVGDPAAGEVALRQLAARKLKNMMARRAAGRAPGQSGWNDLA